MEEYEIVALQELSNGNGEVGYSRIESRIFKSTDRLEDVIAWSKKVSGYHGRLMLSQPWPR